MLRSETFGLGNAFAPFALLRQQQGGNAAPRRQRDGTGRRWAVEREPWRQRGTQTVARGAGRVPQQRRQRGEHTLLAQRFHRRELVVDEPLQRTLEPGTQHFRFAAQQAEPLIAPRQ